MRPSKIDIPVLLIFFCRPIQFRQVFEQVREAAPSKLYLYQDGARSSHPRDMEGIVACREIAGGVDWDCEVHRFFQDENQGCDPSEYIAQRWMFSEQEYGIVLEDDDVPSQSFFPYCKELLERYKDDDRVNIICGMNNAGVSDHVESSYLFTTLGSIWGWASWQRVVMSWDKDYSMLNDKDAVRLISENYPNSAGAISTWVKYRDSGIEHYEGIMGSSAWLNGRLNIVPKYNMITSVGISEDSTHSVNDLRKLSRWTQRLFGAKRYEIDFPLKHPLAVLPDRTHEKNVCRSWLMQKFDRIEGVLRRIVYR